MITIRKGFIKYIVYKILKYGIDLLATAIIFLLTTNEVLWNITENAVCLNGFDFSNIHLRQISTEGYALYQTAKTIWSGKEYIRISEIADRELIDDASFKIITNASLIAKYGANELYQ